MDEKKEKEKNSVCSHMPLIINFLKDDKFKTKSFLDNLSKGSFKCQTCSIDSKKKLWFCLHSNCEFCGCGEFPSKEDNHCIFHYESTKKTILHCLFIEVFSYQIVCFDCQQEIYDIEVYKEFPIDFFQKWPNPKAIRELLFNADHRIFVENLAKRELTNPKVHWNSTKGLCGIISVGNINFINCVLQAMSNIPAVKKIFKKIYKAFEIINIKKDYHPKSSSLKVIFEFSKFIHKVWIGKWRVFNPKDLINYLYILFPHYRSYGFHDSFEIWKFFISTFHNEYKFAVNSESNDSFIDDEWKVITHPEKYIFSSFITDIFSFPVHQIIKCGKCEHILQTTILQKYEISVDLSKMKEDYIMNLAEKKIPEFFYLNDCLTYYFFQNQTIETPTDFLTNCPKCQKIPTALTKSQEIKSYPNVLCIHLNRFSRQEKENIYVDFPSEELDLNYFFDDKECIYEFLGVIEHSKIKGHEKYKTVIRHHKNGVYFLMDDALITKVEKKIVHESQAYILIYGLKSTKQNKMIKHNISSQRKLLKEKQVQLDDKDLETVPYFWYEKLMTLKNPGRINSEFYCCPHNLIKPDFYDCFPLLEFNNCKYFSEFFRNLFIFQSSDDNINELYETQMNKIFCQTRINVQRMSFESITLPKAIVEYIYDHYGGKNLIADMKICQKCLVYTQNLRQRKLLERSLINKYESIQSSVFAVVEKEWYNIWREFLYSEQRFSTRHFIKGYPLPGAINNSNLLINSEEDIPLHDLHLGKHYVIVSGYVWMILKSVYDGGPAILREEETIYSKTIEDLPMNISEIDEQTIKIIRLLSDENFIE